MLKKASCLFLLFCLWPLLSSYADLIPIETAKISAKISAKVNAGEMRAVFVPKTGEDMPKVKVSAGPCQEKTSFARIRFDFDVPIDLEGMKEISFHGSSTGKIFPKLTLICAEGELDSDFLKTPVATNQDRVEFKRGAFSEKGKPDLSRVKSIELGLGLWALDMTKTQIDLILGSFECLGPHDAFIIPLPTTGVSIDGEYKDWGYENVLYFWTPPAYVKLNKPTQLISGTSSWKGPEQLSGNFSFMMDDKNLYFLALVSDQSLFSGNEGNNPWENDSIEIFMAFNVDDRELSDGIPLHQKGIQIVYDCNAQSGIATVIGAAGKNRSALVKTKIVPQTMLIDGQQCSGYVLESAIPIELLPIPGGKREKGMPVAFAIKLNDSATHVSLCTAPSNPKPYQNIAGFRKAFIEIEQKKGAEIRFGETASNVYWPTKYSSEKNRRIWNLEDAWKDESNCKSIKRICLNGLWAIQDAANGSASPDATKWIYGPCPMGIGWAMPAFSIAAGGKDILSSEKIGNSLLDIKRNFFWYERTFDIPTDFKDAKIYLDFEYIEKEADVYINKAFAGTVSLLNNNLDIGKFIKRGEVNRLDLMLYTKVNPSYSYGNGSSGLTGDIYLEFRESAPLLKDAWVKKASGVDGAFEIELSSVPVAAGMERSIQFEICGPDGGRVFRDEKVSKGGRENIKGVLKDFQQWSPDKPILYTLNITLLEDGSIVDEKKIRFGFRTFELKNAKFMLNGKVLRLRASEPTFGETVVPGEFKELKKFGYNCMNLNSDALACGADSLFDRLDEEGFVTFAPIIPTWSNEVTAKMVNVYRNHPSVIGYVSDSFGQLSVNGWGYNPFAIADDSYYPNSDNAKKIYKHLQDRRDLFASLDPTRPYISHGTGNLEGSLKNTHHYPTYDLTMIDRMMYYQSWADRPNPLCPHYIYECGLFALTTMDSTHPEFMFPVNDSDGKIKEVDRLITRESASRYLGCAAFDNWNMWDVMTMKAGLRGLRASGIDGFFPFTAGGKFLSPVNTKKAEDIPDRRKLSYEYFVTPFRKNIDDSWMRESSWLYSLRAQALWPWPEKYAQGEIAERPSIFTPLFLNEMQPFCAFIGGRQDMIYSQEHNYSSGEQIDKTIVACNDTERPMSLPFRATFSVGDKQEEQIIKSDMAQGQIVKLPFSFRAPEVTVKTKGEIKLAWTMPDGTQRQDSFTLTLFPKLQDKINVPSAIKIGIVPSPDDTSLISKMNLPFTKCGASNAFSNGINFLVFERGSFGKDIDVRALKDFLDQGGRMLVMEQTDSSILDWRLRERQLETLFPAAIAHPVLKGLDAADLSFLRGPDDLLPTEHRPSVHFRNGLSAAMETPHLSNEGISAAYVMDKPSYGNFLPLIVGGYDLEEAALLEVRSGNGIAMFCQVDVSGRYGKDPAATLLARNIVKYMLNEHKVRPPTNVLYMGGPKGAALLDRLGVKYAKQASKGCHTLVLGDNTAIDKEILAKFKSVVVLPCSNYLPEGINAEPIVVKSTDYPYSWNSHFDYQFSMLKSIYPGADRMTQNAPPEFEGIVDNDLYYFESPELKSYKAGNDLNFWHSAFSTLALARQGAARIVLCSVDPEKMKSGETRKKAYRIWSLIFSNLGGSISFSPSWQTPTLDLSSNEWTLLTDPDGSGEKVGFQNGNFDGRKPRPIVVGKVWEDQGITEVNPNINNPEDSQYDGFAWYFTKVVIPKDIQDGKIYLHADGIKDSVTYNRTENKTDLFINGVKMSPPERIYNAYMGGCGARLWAFDSNVLKKGKENLFAIRIFNNSGPAGLFRKPVRLEFEGKNQDIIFPYEFQKSKYTPYFFWSW